MPTYDLEHFAEITDSLDDLEPEVEQPSARDVVFAAYDKIKEMTERGVSYRKILKKYQEGGLELSMSTFRQYLLDAKQARIEARKQEIAQKAKATRERNRRAAEADTDAPNKPPLKPARNPSGITPKLPDVDSGKADDTAKAKASDEDTPSIVGRYKRVPPGSVPPPVPVVTAEVMEDE